MTRYITPIKWIIGAIAFLIIFAGACYLWYQHELVYERKKDAVAAEFARKWEIERKAAAKPVAKDENQVPAGSQDTTAEKTVNEVTAEVQNNTDAETQQQSETPAATAEIEDMPTSPFGLGPYPEVPDDLRSIKRFKPVWEYPKWPNVRMAKAHELMSRVTIKLWQEGERDWVGMGGDENRIYVNYPNTVYVTWKKSEVTWDETEDDEYITTLSGDPSACLRIRSNTIARLGIPGPSTKADIPSDIEVKLHSESGIDPYSCLNLLR